MSRRAIAGHQAPPPRVTAGESRTSPLASDGLRSLRSLGVDGWLTVLALVASSIALAPFVNRLGLRGVDAGTVWLGLYLLTCIRLVQVKGIAWPLWLVRRHWALCGFLVLTVVSATWSEHPGVTLNRAASLIGTTIVGVFVGQVLSQRAMMTAWMWGLTLLVGTSLAVYLLAPELADDWIADWDGRFRGLGTGKNVIGKYLVFGAVLAAAATAKGLVHRPLGVALTAMYVAATLLTESSTSLLALAAGIAAFTGILLAKRLHLSTSMVLGLIGVGTVVFVSLGISQIETITTYLGKKPTLSGRTELWAATLDAIARQPFFGYGYFAIWNRPETNDFLNAFSPNDFRWSAVPHAHNGFIHVATDLGIPAAILMVAYVINTLVQAIRTFMKEESAFSLFAVAFVTSYIVMNIGELTMLRSRSGMWIAFVAVTLALARSTPRRQLAPDRRPIEPGDGPAAEPAHRRARSAPEDGAAADLPEFRQELEHALVQRRGGRPPRQREPRQPLAGTLPQRPGDGATPVAKLRHQVRKALRRRARAAGSTDLRRALGQTLTGRHVEEEGDARPERTDVHRSLGKAVKQSDHTEAEDPSTPSEDVESSSR